MRVLGEAPFNAGAPPALHEARAVTPVDLFFTRNHGAVPSIAVAAWRLRVGGLVTRPAELSLDDLRRAYQWREVTTTLVCAGLRRTELVAVRPIPGELPWDAEPAGTARFAGVALRDVLLAAGVGEEARHVGLLGLDAIERKGRRFGFGGSIALAKGLAPEVLIALEMNGEPLPAVHGGPARLVVPGYIGARSVKWLGEIELRSEPSDNYFQAEAYRVLAEPAAGDPRDVSSGAALAELPLNSVILSPAPGDDVAAGPREVSGWAYGGDGHAVDRVEVSPDGGESWVAAQAESAPGPWAWLLWRATVPLAAGRPTLVVRAWDAAGRGQPERLSEVWNVKGYANNAWHRVTVRVTS
jgi:sulfite oxidase